MGPLSTRLDGVDIAAGVAVETTYQRLRFGRAVGRGPLLASLGATAAASSSARSATSSTG